MIVTVSIIIPVFNESSNITQLIASIRAQRQICFKLEKIYVVSDGSYDDTNDLVNSVLNQDLQLIPKKERKGKCYRINEMFEVLHTDIAVVLDGDILFSHENALNELIVPFTMNYQVGLTSGNAIPYTPTTIAERIAWTSNDLWKYILSQNTNTEMYRCEGKIRAFSKAFYQQIRFPLASADDVFAYFAAIEYGFNFSYVKTATVNYQLPQTMADYQKQSLRFLHSKGIQLQHFNERLVADRFYLGPKHKFIGLITYFIHNPFWTLLYLISLIYLKIAALMPYNDNLGKWDIASTTKTRNISQKVKIESPSGVIPNIIMYLSLSIENPKDFLFVLNYSTKEKVNISRFDPDLKQIGLALTEKIQKLIPKFSTLYVGSSALEIAGQRDIDIIIACPKNSLRQAVEILEPVLGIPQKQRRYFVDYRIFKKDFKIDVTIMDPKSRKYIRQLESFLMMKENLTLRSNYEKLKLSLNGTNKRDYYLHQMYFLNNMYTHYINQKRSRFFAT